MKLAAPMAAESGDSKEFDMVLTFCRLQFGDALYQSIETPKKW